MPYTNYAELQAGVSGWLHRNDLKTRAPEFIALAELKINRIAQVRAMEQEVSLPLAPGVRTVALPAGFVSPISAWLDGSPRQALAAVVPEQMPVSASAGAPTYWSIDGSTLAVERPTDVARVLTLRYRGSFTLSDENPANALLTKYPDLYLYGTLLQTAAWSRSIENVSLWQEMYNRAVTEVNRTESRARAIAPLRTEIADLLGHGCHTERTFP